MNRNSRLSLLFTFAFVWSAQAVSAQALNTASDGNPFTGKDAAAVITDALAKEGIASDIKVTISEARDEDIIAQGQGLITAEADGLELDKARNHWQATLLMKAQGHNLAPIRLSGHYEEMAQVPVLKRRIQSGEVIGEEDIDWDREPLQRLRKNTVTDIHDLIGKSPRRVISQGRPIRTDEIASPAIVNKGEQVTMFFKSGNIEIKTYGEAIDSGAKGDVIRVRNTTSKAVVQGTIESNQSVRVSSPGSDAAEAM